MHRLLQLSSALSIVVMLAALAGPLHAADWPTRLVTVIVPFGAGGNSDMLARLGAQHLTAKFGQTFLVENRPSAGGALGTGQVATSAPDGYTLLFSPSSVVNLTPQVQKLSFDPRKQLVPITNLGTGTQMIAIKRELPVTTLPELIAHAKANPGKPNFAIAGTNNITHLAHCIKTAPEVFRLNAENRSEVLSPWTAPDEFVLKAARSCPYRAIIVVDVETGQQIHPRVRL